MNWCVLKVGATYGVLQLFSTSEALLAESAVWRTLVNWFLDALTTSGCFFGVQLSPYFLLGSDTASHVRLNLLVNSYFCFDLT